jgi:phosphate transport system permease protein
MTTTLDRPRGQAGSEILSARQRRRAELTGRDRLVRAALTVAGVVPTAILVFLAYQMVRQAIPAIRFSGWHFFQTKTFNLGSQYGNPQVHNGEAALPKAQFGVLAMLFGTLVSSLLALILALPVSVAGAVLLVEKLPARLQGTLGVFLELLAGIPSVVFGLWGVYTIGPWLHRTVFQWISDLGIPWFSGNSTTNPQGLATASVILAVMIIPIIASITRELVRSVPVVTKEGAVALGLTPTETVRFVTIPFVRTGVMAAAVLGWARALGETIAVLLISGNQLTVPHSVFDPFTTISASIAQLLDSALQDPTNMDLHALAEVGLVLLVVTLATNFGGRLLTRRFSDAGLPVGRGV